MRPPAASHIALSTHNGPSNRWSSRLSSSWSPWSPPDANSIFNDSNKIGGKHNDGRKAKAKPKAKQEQKKSEAMSDNSASFAIQNVGGKAAGVASNEEEDLEAFHSDEEPENSESQKEDMKTYLSKLNKRIDTLVDALKEAEKLISKQTSERAIREQVQARDRHLAAANGDKVSIAEFFNSKIKQ